MPLRKKDKGRSSSSLTSSSSNPKRHSLDSNIHASPNHSTAIPRGNGHQAMSIPMPPPPSLYFSLLPQGSSSNQPQTDKHHNHGRSSLPGSLNNSPRPSPSIHHQQLSTSSASFFSGNHGNSVATGRDRSKSMGSKQQPHSDPSTPSAPPSLYLTPSNHSTQQHLGITHNRPGNGSYPTTPSGYSHYHTHHHPPRSTYPLSMTHSRRSSLSHTPGVNSLEEDQRQKMGFFDMAIFDPSPDKAKSARSSVDHDRSSHRFTVSRPPSIESMNSSNSVPFAPPPPPPPSAWKRFWNHFSKRVIKRHVKFIIALYISCAMALIPEVASLLGPTPYLANVAVVFMHPARTIGSQLEVTLFSIIGAVLAALWILPCNAAVAAYNQRYLAGGNHSAWAISAAWFFIGVWIMTMYKARYAKLNCAFIIYTIAGIFALTRNHKSVEFDFFDFWNLMGPMMLGVAICLVVSIVCWPETASEGLGRALNESLDTSRALLNLSTHSFLLNHKTIALPKSAIEKAQSEVRLAQKKLYSAYREARYEVTYSMTNPADYKEVRVIVSALMRHLGSMSLVVQNERLLMLGHPDRDDEDLLTQSGGAESVRAASMMSSTSASTSSSYSSYSSASSTSSFFCSSGSESDSEDEKDAGAPGARIRYENDSGELIHQQGDYFGNATAKDADLNSRQGQQRPHHGRHHGEGHGHGPDHHPSDHHHHHHHAHHHSQHRHHHKKTPLGSPAHENGPAGATTTNSTSTPTTRRKRRGSAAELRRIRQLLQRAENSTEAALKARQNQAKQHQKDLQQHLQQAFQLERGGVATAPPTPSGGAHAGAGGLLGTRSIFAAHRLPNKGSSASSGGMVGGPSTIQLKLPHSKKVRSNVTSPASSRANSIHEEQNLDTVKSFTSLFSVHSKSKKIRKQDRPASLKAGFKLGGGNDKKDKKKKKDKKNKKDRDSEEDEDEEEDYEAYLAGPGISLDEMQHYATVPTRMSFERERRPHRTRELKEGGNQDEDEVEDSLGESSSRPRTLRFVHSSTAYSTPLPLSDHQFRKAAQALRKQKQKQLKRERKQAEREAKEERDRIEKQEAEEAAARAIPPKEVAFGDRKLFMSFLDIVRDPLQRLSDSCSRVMVAMERELVSGLNVEQDRLERIRRRNAQRAAALRAAEARAGATEDGSGPCAGTPGSGAAATGGAAAAGGAGSGAGMTDSAAAAGTKCAPGVAGDPGVHSDSFNVLKRLRELIGVKPRHLTKEDLDYAEAMRSGQKSKKGKKTRLAGDTVHPNKFLERPGSLSGNVAGTPGCEDNVEDEDFILPQDMSYVQYLTQELEVFDKAEAEGLRDFIATHPTLDVGPREEIFLIFFFLFALREIARELLRLGKYVQELEEREQEQMEEQGRTKRRKQLWWPKVFDNFWHWFAWGSYSQVKTSEGYNALILNTTKNLEHRQPRTIQEEKALVEAKAATKAAQEKVQAAETATKAAADKKKREAALARFMLRQQQQREQERLQQQQGGRRSRRHSETWEMPPLRRSVTLSALIHRKTSRGSRHLDLEQGLGLDQDQVHGRVEKKLTGVLKNGNRQGQQPEPSEKRSDVLAQPRRHRSHEGLDSPPNRSSSSAREKNAGNPLNVTASRSSPGADATSSSAGGDTLGGHLGDPSVLGAQEVLTHDPEDEEELRGEADGLGITGAAAQPPKSELGLKYRVVDIPDFESLRHQSQLRQFKDTNVVDLQPRISTMQHRRTAPPDLAEAASSAVLSTESTEVAESASRRISTNEGGGGTVLISEPSSSHQDRYPSFASSTSPALLPGDQIQQQGGQQNETSVPLGGNEEEDGSDSDSDSGSSDNSSILRERARQTLRQLEKPKQSRSKSLFAAFGRGRNRHPRTRSIDSSDADSAELHRQQQERLDRQLEEILRQQKELEDKATQEYREKEKQLQEEQDQQQQQQQPTALPVFINVSKPKTWRYRVWEFLQPFKSEEFKFGFKMAVALTFIGLWSWLQWMNSALATDRGQWAMLTVMAVLSPTVGATFSVCAMRIAGTLAGTLWALVTFLALPRNPWVICVMMLFIAFAGVFLILESAHPKLGIIMMLSYSSITFIMYEGKTSETIYEVCYKRAVTVIIGIIISVMMNSLLWPILARRELRKEIAFLIGRQGVLFAELVNKFLLEDPDPKHAAAGSLEERLFKVQLEEDEDDESESEKEEREVYAKMDQFEKGFVPLAEEQALAEKRAKARAAGEGSPDSHDTPSTGTNSSRSSSENSLSRRRKKKLTSLRHQADEDALNAMDPDRLAFQHVEHQLQTKLIKILQLLELSGSEPRLKEEFPMKLYKQIIQCCQNILDRMVSMRMAAQLLSPEVRELVTGPMNFYRRDMVGALLLYFSVLSSSLASKSPLPPYLPSARMARLRVIYNVREAIAAHQAITGEDHYTYIYYYAFSSALEEVIEELELLAILIKPIVGVTLVSSGDHYSCGISGDQLNLGPTMANSQIGLPSANPVAPNQVEVPDQGPLVTMRDSGVIPQQLKTGSNSHEQHAGLGGNLAGDVTSVPGLRPGMIILGTSAGTGAGAFGSKTLLGDTTDLYAGTGHATIGVSGGSSGSGAGSGAMVRSSSSTYLQRRLLEQQQAQQQSHQLLQSQQLLVKHQLAKLPIKSQERVLKEMNQHQHLALALAGSDGSSSPLAASQTRMELPLPGQEEGSVPMMTTAMPTQQQQYQQLQIQIQQQQQILAQLQQQQKRLNFHPELAIQSSQPPLAPRMVIKEDGGAATERMSLGSRRSSAASGGASSVSSRHNGKEGKGKSKVEASVSFKPASGVSPAGGVEGDKKKSAVDARSAAKPPVGLKIKTATDKITPCAAAAGVSNVHSTAAAAAAAALSSPIIRMDENILGGRHAQRYKEAIEAAQEVSGQKVIQVVPPSSLPMIPGTVGVRPVGLMPMAISSPIPKKGASGSSGGGGGSGSMVKSPNFSEFSKSSHPSLALSKSPNLMVASPGVLSTSSGGSGAGRRVSVTERGASGSSTLEPGSHRRHHHHHHHPSADLSRIPPMASEAVSPALMMAGGSSDGQDTQAPPPPMVHIPISAVMPFGSDFVPLAPLPLHMIPTRAQARAASGDGQNGEGEEEGEGERDLGRDEKDGKRKWL